MTPEQIAEHEGWAISMDGLWFIKDPHPVMPQYGYDAFRISLAWCEEYSRIAEEKPE
jgi:hypothetical protein